MLEILDVGSQKKLLRKKFGKLVLRDSGDAPRFSGVALCPLLDESHEEASPWRSWLV
ncbi:MAG: hypothetical protein WCE49_11080 [Terrimicrobiaceae bacterium]